MSRRSRRVHFANHSGITLAGILELPVGRENPPMVVFSHCFTCGKDMKTIVRLARGLAERGIGVLRFDMTGLGDSQGQFSQAGFGANLADLRSAIAFVEQEAGPVTGLVGHSFGGAASLALAGGQLPSLRAVVTVAAPSDTRHLAELLARMDPAIERQGAGRVTIGGRPWPITRAMLDDFRRHDLPAQIAAVRLPVLLFHSPDDHTVRFDHAIRIQNLIRNPPAGGTASLVALPGADHLLMDDPRDLAFIVETAAAFLHRYAAHGDSPRSP